MASGNGSNTEKIIHFFESHNLIEVALLLCNNPDAYVLERARRNNVPSIVFKKKDLQNVTALLGWLKDAQITHIVLAGFLLQLPSALIGSYPDRIINIHPALLPKYGGRGMYGMNVHKAVLTAGDRETGITIHLVNEEYDQGRILFQERCAVESTDSPERLAEKVQALEYANYPSIIEKWIINHNP